MGCGMNRFPVTTIALVLLGSCGAMQNRMEERKEAFTRNMDGWVARSVDELVAEKGPPTITTRLSSGGKELEYAKRNVVVGASGPYVVSIYDPTAGGRVPQLKMSGISTNDLTCKFVFRISPANIIESWSATGNDCY